MKLFSGIVFTAAGLGAIVLVGSETGYVHAFQIVFYSILMNQGLRQIVAYLIQKRAENRGQEDKHE